MRWLPASGARVREVPVGDASQASRTAALSTRSEGSESLHLGVRGGDAGQHLLQAGVVGGGERGEGQLLVAGGGQFVAGQLEDLGRPAAPAPAGTTCPPGRSGSPGCSRA